jgi:hypothetical protein
MFTDGYGKSSLKVLSLQLTTTISNIDF